MEYSEKQTAKITLEGREIGFLEPRGNCWVHLLTLPISSREMEKGGEKAARCDPELPEAESLYHPLGVTAVTDRKKRVDVSGS